MFVAVQVVDVVVVVLAGIGRDHSDGPRRDSILRVTSMAVLVIVEVVAEVVTEAEKVAEEVSIDRKVRYSGYHDAKNQRKPSLS